jgi:hypothetical protein
MHLGILFNYFNLYIFGSETLYEALYCHIKVNDDDISNNHFNYSILRLRLLVGFFFLVFKLCPFLKHSFIHNDIPTSAHISKSDSYSETMDFSFQSPEHLLQHQYPHWYLPRECALGVVSHSDHSLVLTNAVFLPT